MEHFTIIIAIIIGIIGFAIIGLMIWLWLARMKDVFERATHKIFADRERQFSQQAHHQLQTSLEPFRRDMEHLRQTVETSSREHFSLKEQIERIGAQANNLADALKSRPQMRGHWGEIMLKKMLQDAGLLENKDYILQPNIKNTDDQNRHQNLRPDAILYLPENKHLIIDSKLSLISYEQYITQKDEAERQQALKAFLDATRKHIRDLSDKQYPYARELQAPDFTILFMPIEGAYITAMTMDDQLHRFAWEKKIVIVSPSTLFAILQTIASLWQLDKQSQYASEIARQGGALYDKIAAFCEDMRKMGDQINRAQDQYEGAMKKLTTGNGNILSRTQKLKKLGARTSKQLPNHE